jgi:hypothetical protein
MNHKLAALRELQPFRITADLGFLAASRHGVYEIAQNLHALHEVIRITFRVHFR